MYPFTATFLNIAVSGLPGYIFKSYRDLADDWPCFSFLSKTYSCYCTRGNVPSDPVYSVLRWALGEKGLAQSSNEPSKKFPAIGHASVNFKLQEEGGGGFTSEPRAAEHSLRVSFFVCSSVFSPTSFSLSSCLLSSFFNLTFLHPPSCWITQSLSFHPPFSLSSEYLCNSYSYLLVGARIRASLLMCSRSPRGRGDRENILKS